MTTARGPRATFQSSGGAAPAQLTLLPDGPYQVTGSLEITGLDGASIAAPEPVYLCRCGRSATKPFCDGSHARTGWKEDA
jgi:Iron-binding zinc finger CDGSH type